MYSRDKPSRRYRTMVELYREMHVEGDRTIGMPSERTFAGGSLLPHVSEIKQLIDESGAQTLFDYGAGKGYQYAWRDLELPDGSRIDSLTAYWGVDDVTLYDPGYEPLADLPSGRFDGVICTDVLEHCPAEDIPWILEEVFGFARRFVYATIASHRAIKTLPNGENAHCTVRPPDWWQGLLHGIAHRHPGIRYRVQVRTKVEPRTILGRRRKPVYATTILDNRDELIAPSNATASTGFDLAGSSRSGRDPGRIPSPDARSPQRKARAAAPAASG
jgi:hypothetical protein